jgi:hypothetical protein
VAILQEFTKTLKKIGIPEGKMTKVNKDGVLDEYTFGGKAINDQNQTEARATCKALLQLIAKIEAEQAMAFDTMVLLCATNTLLQRGDISAIRSLEFGGQVDALKLKPLHERPDRFIVAGQSALESIVELTKEEKKMRAPPQAEAPSVATPSKVMKADNVCWGWVDGTCSTAICPRDLQRANRRYISSLEECVCRA